MSEALNLEAAMLGAWLVCGSCSRRALGAGGRRSFLV